MQADRAAAILDFLAVADRLKTVEIVKSLRGGEKPSDHVPIYADLA